MTALDCPPAGCSRHPRGWACRLRANASWVSIRMAIAALRSGDEAKAGRRLRFHCRCDLRARPPVARPDPQIRVLVVDDEAPARQRLIDLLKKDPQIGNVLEAVNGKDAVQ